jgi:hypothetical protein
MIRKLSFLFEGGVLKLDYLGGIALWKATSNACTGKIIKLVRNFGK